jgi:hypothetical protein
MLSRIESDAATLRHVDLSDYESNTADAIADKIREARDALALAFAIVRGEDIQ